jgi:hypothetical protein
MSELPGTITPARPDHPANPETSRQEGQYEITVPTVADRIAQTVVAMELEKRVEPRFHPDSYGYRPGRSALDAVGKCRRRCWEQDWVVDLDIQKFFDSVDHSLMVKAVEANTDQPWVVLYVKRWLGAPIQHSEGSPLPYSFQAYGVWCLVFWVPVTVWLQAHHGDVTGCDGP